MGWSKSTLKSLFCLFLIVAFLSASAGTIKTNSIKLSVRAKQPMGNGTYTTQPFNQNFGVVYVRIPRTVGGSTAPAGTTPSVPINGQFDTFPETGHWVSGMSGPGQLVYRDANGNETILFDCISQQHTPIVAGLASSVGPKPCLPMDPSVSFDGKKVLFSVLYASFEPTTYAHQTFSANGAVMSRIVQTPLGAQIFEADLTSKTVRALDYKALGDFDTSPIYIPWDESNPLDRDRIMFTTNRARELPSSQLWGSRPAGAFNRTLLQLYIADQDLKNARRTGVHDRDGVLHPFVMSDGRVLFTTWSLSHMGSYRRNNGSARGHASLENEAWLASVDSKGGTFNAEFGRHGKYWMNNSNASTAIGLHFITQSSDRLWLCASDYYRTNNMGGGITRCFQREFVGVEGPYNVSEPGSVFMPRYIKSAFNFGTNSDTSDPIGGTRDPAALPGNQLLVTFLKGNACLRPDVARYTYSNNVCDTGIYKTTTFPSSPGDMVKIVDDPNYHEFMARVAEPYSFVYGQAKPFFSGHQSISPNNRCYIGSSSMQAEVDPLSPYSFNSSGASSQDCAVQGCKARGVSLDQVAAIRFWEVLPNDSNFLHSSPDYANTGQPNFLKSLVGNRLALLGDAPLKTDRSFVAEIPCDTTYVMAGVTARGEVVTRDQVTQSLRPGEVRTCTGCHLHSGKAGPPFETSLAGLELAKHFNNQSSSVSFLTLGGGFKEIWQGNLVQQVSVNSSGIVSPADSSQGQIYEYNKHIVPIINSSCTSCHGGSTAPDLRETGVRSNFFAEIAPSHEQSVYLPTVLWNRITNEKPPLAGDWEIPRLSKYLHMGFALESLFYWKSAGTRADGRSDSAFANDLDYGPLAGPDPHAGINPDHVRILKNWIDSGAYLHQGSLPMNYRPPAR